MWRPLAVANISEGEASPEGALRPTSPKLTLPQPPSPPPVVEPVWVAPQLKLRGWMEPGPKSIATGGSPPLENDSPPKSMGPEPALAAPDHFAVWVSTSAPWSYSNCWKVTEAK